MADYPEDNWTIPTYHWRLYQWWDQQQQGYPSYPVPSHGYCPGPMEAAAQYGNYYNLPPGVPPQFGAYRQVVQGVEHVAGPTSGLPIPRTSVVASHNRVRIITPSRQDGINPSSNEAPSSRRRKTRTRPTTTTGNNRSRGRVYQSAQSNNRGRRSSSSYAKKSKGDLDTRHHSPSESTETALTVVSEGPPTTTSTTKPSQEDMRKQRKAELDKVRETLSCWKPSKIRRKLRLEYVIEKPVCTPKAVLIDLLAYALVDSPFTSLRYQQQQPPQEQDVSDSLSSLTSSFDIRGSPETTSTGKSVESHGGEEEESTLRENRLEEERQKIRHWQPTRVRKKLRLDYGIVKPVGTADKEELIDLLATAIVDNATRAAANESESVACTTSSRVDEQRIDREEKLEEERKKISDLKFSPSTLRGKLRIDHAIQKPIGTEKGELIELLAAANVDSDEQHSLIEKTALFILEDE